MIIEKKKKTFNIHAIISILLDLFYLSMNKLNKNIVSNTTYIAMLLTSLFIEPFSLLKKREKKVMKLIKQDWRSETFLTAFPLSGFSVKVGGNSSVLSSVCRATFHRFLSLSTSGRQYFSVLKRKLELLRSSVSAFAYAAVRTVMIIRFVIQNTRHNLRLKASCNEYFALKVFKHAFNLY